MSKSQDAFRTIGDVADWLGAPTHVLRFWESRFTQIRPIKGEGGVRFYRPSDMALLGGIKKLLQQDGLTIGAVQALLRERGVPHVASQSPLDPNASEPKGARVENRDSELTRTAERETENGARDVLVLEPPPSGTEASRPPDPASRQADGAGVVYLDSERVEGAELKEEADDDADNVLVLGQAAEHIDASQPLLPFDGGRTAPEELARPMSGDAPSGAFFPDSDNGTAAGFPDSREREATAPEEVGYRDERETPGCIAVPAPDQEEASGTPRFAGDPERPALAEEVLALLRNGARAEPDDLRPLYGRLRELRERMAPDRPDTPNGG